MAKGAADIVVTVLTVVAAVGAVGAYAHFMKIPDAALMVENGPGLSADSTISDVRKMQPYLALRQGLPEDAYAGVSGLLKNKKYDVKNYMCAGDVYIEGPDVALKDRGYLLLRDTVYLCPESRFVRLNFARELVKIKRLEEASREYDKLCAAFPKWRKPRLEQAVVFIRLQQPQDAYRRVQEVLAIDAGNAEAMKLAGILKGDDGASNKDAAKLKDGFDLYMKGFEADKKLKAPGDLEELVAENDNSIDKTIATVQAQVAANKTDLPARLVLARLLIFAGKDSEAKSLIEQAKAQSDKDKDENAPDLHRLLAEILHASGDDTGALAEFKMGAAGDTQPS